jgi:hypothetical protein
MGTLINSIEEKEGRVADSIRTENPANIRGWGVDADAQNMPNYPIKHYTGADHERLKYPRASQQPLDVEILHSNERPSVTRVFGTSTPPSGLSGKLRRYAFKYSEGNSIHWLTLILADRINAIEGIVDDLKRGHIPNIFKERGWTAEWKYNKKGVIKNVAIGTAVTAALVTYFVLKNRRRTAQQV